MEYTLYTVNTQVHKSTEFPANIRTGIYECVCVYTHTHTYIYIYTYMCVYIYVCVCVCVCVQRVQNVRTG